MSQDRGEKQEQELRLLDERWIGAYEAGNATTMDGIWAEDCFFIGPEGEILDKAQMLAQVGSGASTVRWVLSPAA